MIYGEVIRHPVDVCIHVHNYTQVLTHMSVLTMHNLSQLKEVTNRNLRWRKIKIAPQSRKAGRYVFWGKEIALIDLT